MQCPSLIIWGDQVNPAMLDSLSPDINHELHEYEVTSKERATATSW